MRRLLALNLTTLLCCASNASVDQPASIDLVSLNKEKTEVSLSIVQQLAWSNRTLSLLDRKIATYVAFIERGQLSAQFPEARGKSVLIVVSYLEEPTSEGVAQLKRHREALAAKRIGLVWSKLPSPK